MSQSRSPGAVRKLVPGAYLMAGPEGSVVAGLCAHTQHQHFLALGLTPHVVKIQAAKVPSTAESRELGTYCWWLGK